MEDELSMRGRSAADSNGVVQRRIDSAVKDARIAQLEGAGARQRS